MKESVNLVMIIYFSWVSFEVSESNYFESRGTHLKILTILSNHQVKLNLYLFEEKEKRLG